MKKQAITPEEYFKKAREYSNKNGIARIQNLEDKNGFCVEWDIYVLLTQFAEDFAEQEAIEFGVERISRYYNQFNPVKKGLQHNYYQSKRAIFNVRFFRNLYCGCQYTS